MSKATKVFKQKSKSNIKASKNSFLFYAEDIFLSYKDLKQIYNNSSHEILNQCYRQFFYTIDRRHAFFLDCFFMALSL